MDGRRFMVSYGQRRRAEVTPQGSGSRIQWAIIVALLLMSCVQLLYMSQSMDNGSPSAPLSRRPAFLPDTNVARVKLQMQAPLVDERPAQLELSDSQVKSLLRKVGTSLDHPGRDAGPPTSDSADEGKNGRTAKELSNALQKIGELELELQQKSRELIAAGKVLSVMPETRLWDGPLDVDDAAEAHMQEILQQWKAGGRIGPRPGIQPVTWERFPPWPFQRLKTMDGKDTGVIAVCAPFTDNYYRGQMERGIFWRLKSMGHIMIGLSSYMHFPGEIHNPWDRRHVKQDADIHRAMDGWLHCFRTPDDYLPPGVPRIMLSESDFYDVNRNDDNGVLVPKGLDKKYDFIHINGGGEWNEYNRNWTLAKSAIIMFARDMNLSTLVVGHDVTSDEELKPYVDQGLVIPGEKHAWKDFLDDIEAARALFVPNVHDASPRVITEALCRNVPLLMNWHIAGGWKYVNDGTGVLFNDMSDIKEAVTKLRSPEFASGLQPREYFSKHHGKFKSGLKLLAFLDLVVGPGRLAAARHIGETLLEDNGEAR